MQNTGRPLPNREFSDHKLEIETGRQGPLVAQELGNQREEKSKERVPSPLYRIQRGERKMLLKL